MVKCPNEDERGHKSRCPRLFISLFFYLFFLFLLFKFYENGRHAIWIENIGESTLASLFFITLKINMVDFVSSHKVVEGMYF
jgi:hypothetical protein